ncbi:type III-B CRISPR-associated protein Cas10/Cmr2 [bacterium]|nr:type III-B CRISPR-associated protein Cas10/Cmr2 [bacterium]
MPTDWEQLLLAYLHDPPDKAAGIQGHENRAARYASKALGMPVDSGRIHSDSKTEDILASIAERFPMPSAGGRGERAVGKATDGTVLVKHPLSGVTDHVLVPEDAAFEQAVLETLQGIVPENADARTRFFLIWRFLRDRLTDKVPAGNRMPADTRSPDASIWHHLDITAGLRAALADGEDGAFLSFQISPVQGFIASARSLRDLWSGSYILAWLTFQAMLEVVRDLGPTVILFPNLRGVPLLDQWMQEEFRIDSAKLNLKQNELRMPSLPNRFLAVVPWGIEGATAKEFAVRCEQAAREAWEKLSGSVRSKLNSKWEFLQGYPGWDDRWDNQVGQYFDMVSTVVGIRDCEEDEIARWIGGDEFGSVFKEAQAVRDLAVAIPPKERPKYAMQPETDPVKVGRWQAMVDLAGRVQAARRAVRHVPVLDNREGDVPPKCSLFGSFEQMGPDELEDSRKFWETAEGKGLHGVHIRARERFSAPALTKRFAWPAFFDRELNNNKTFRYPDTATVAAADWLENARINPDNWWRDEGTWSGQWLFWTEQQPKGEDEERIPDDLWKMIKDARQEHGKPPAYLSVLMLDGDRMGHWLQGKNSPNVGEILHPDMKKYLEGLPGTEDGLKARRPVGPALHAAISEALTNFSLFVAPSIVKKHKGELVYAGGDDVLALLPTKHAVECAQELNHAFRGDLTVNNGAPEGYYRFEGRDLLMMGTKASTSAGIAVVHYKEDLRFALQQARAAEKRAKNAGRNALALQICKRSGEHAGTVMPWDFAGTFNGWVAAFLPGENGKAAFSDRWSYTLRRELPALSGSWEMFESEARRLLGRAHDSLRDGPKPDQVMQALSNYKDVMSSRKIKPDESSDEDNLDPVMSSFVTLVQSASFLARGRDR